MTRQDNTENDKNTEPTAEKQEILVIENNNYFYQEIFTNWRKTAWKYHKTEQIQSIQNQYLQHLPERLRKTRTIIKETYQNTLMADNSKTEIKRNMLFRAEENNLFNTCVTVRREREREAKRRRKREGLWGTGVRKRYRRRDGGEGKTGGR